MPQNEWSAITSAELNLTYAKLRGLALDQGHVWQRRFYDFVVWTERKRVEKLRYMHRNPVTRGLVLEPEQWPWTLAICLPKQRRGEVLRRVGRSFHRF